jgi:hypothetical protein
VRAHTGIALRAAAALGAGADAEDVVQQAFTKAYCALGRFRDGMAFKPWLPAIVAIETRNTVAVPGPAVGVGGSFPKRRAAARPVAGPPRGEPRQELMDL